MTGSSRNSFLGRLQRSLANDGGLKAQLLRSGMGSAGVHALNRVLALGSGIVLARTLGTEGYGIYAYAFAVMGVLMIPAQAGMPILLMREVAASRAQQRWGFLRGSLLRAVQIVGSASTAIMLIGILVLWLYFSNLDSSRYLTNLFMLLALPIAATSRTIISAVKGLHWVAVGQAMEMLFQPALMLMTVVLVFLLSPELRKSEFAMLIQLGTLLALLIAGTLVLRRFLPAEARAAATEYPGAQWVRNLIPLTLIGGAVVINSQADLIMLGWFRPIEDVGIYRVTSQSAMLVGFLLQAAGAVAGPHFSTLYANGDMPRIAQLLKKTALLVTLGSVPIVACFLFFGGDILAVVFGEEFRSGWLVMGILAIGYFVNISFGPVGMLLQMIGEERATARVLWSTAILNLILNAVLIPMFGPAGAAASTALCVALYHAILRGLIKSSIGI